MSEDYKIRFLRKNRKNKPWLYRLYGAQARCNNPNTTGYKLYGGKGIKCFLTEEQIKYLWERDGASQQKKPSIDRIDSNGNYEIDNCRFIEISENVRRARPLLPRTHCYKGHEYTEDNIKINKNSGHRFCKKCWRKNHREYMHKWVKRKKVQSVKSN